MDIREQQGNERVNNVGKSGMPMVWIVLVVIGMILLVRWLPLGQFGPPAGDGVADPMTPVKATPQGEPGMVPPSAPDETQPSPP
jgi:hypothetical protein